MCPGAHRGGTDTVSENITPILSVPRVLPVTGVTPRSLCFGICLLVVTW